MAVPKSKTSKSKRNLRRSHHALKGVNVSVDKNGNPTRSHQISPEGFYGDRQVFQKPKQPKASASSSAKKV